MTVDINNESGLDGGRPRAGPAGHLRPGPAADPPAGRAVDPAGRRGHDERLPPEVHRRARSDRRAELPDGRAAAARTTTRSRRPACSATSCSARRSPPGRRASTAGRPDAEAEYLLVHGLLHLLGFDHADAGRADRDVRPEGHDPGRAGPARGPTAGRRDRRTAMTSTRLGPAGDRAGPGGLRRVHRRRRGRPVLLLQVPGRPAGGGEGPGRQAGPADRRRPAALSQHRAVPAHPGARSRPSSWWPW